MRLSVRLLHRACKPDSPDMSRIRLLTVLCLAAVLGSGCDSLTAPADVAVGRFESNVGDGPASLEAGGLGPATLTLDLGGGVGGHGQRRPVAHGRGRGVVPAGIGGVRNGRGTVPRGERGPDRDHRGRRGRPGHGVVPGDASVRDVRHGDEVAGRAGGVRGPAAVGGARCNPPLQADKGRQRLCAVRPSAYPALRSAAPLGALCG